MSALGSSVISKSGKKFAPKAPARRPAAPASTQASTRPSVDRQIRSQTPQSQTSQQQVAIPSTPSLSLPTPAPSQQQVTVAPTKATHEDGGVINAQSAQGTPGTEGNAQQSRAISISIASRSASAQTHNSPTPVEARKPPLDPQEILQNGEVHHSPESHHVSEPTVSSSTSNGPNLMYSDFTSPRNHRSTSTERHYSPLGNEITFPSSSSVVPQEEPQAPAAKRRRIGNLQQKSQALQPEASEGSANIPIPSTELSEAVSRASGSANEGSGSLGNVKTKKPRLSAQARRKQQVQDAAAEIVADATQASSTKPKKPRKNAKGKTVQGVEGDAPGGPAGPSTGPSGPNDSIAAPAKAKKKYTRRKPKQSIQDAAAEVVEDAVQGSSKDPKKRGRTRAVTPEGADKVTISPSTMKMVDLCMDSRIGRKSEREKDLEEFERAEFVRKKQKELQELMGQAGSDRGSSETAEARSERLGRQREQEGSVANHVPNTVIVNGQIMIDEASLQIDRHAAADADRDAEQLEAIEETDLTRKVNSASWLKRDKSGGWNELLTEKFYDGLRMFGTDFEMISKMFPGRTRHKIKLKFVKEEKINHDKIKATLLGEKIPVDLPELEKMAGLEFDDPKDLERDLEEDRKRLEEETLAEKQAMDDARREREEQIAAERAAAGGEESAKENRRGKSKRKNREKRKGSKGPSRQKENHANRASTTAGDNMLGEFGEMAGD